MAAAATADKPTAAVVQAEPFTPVEFWNAHEPNERILLEDATDPAARRFVQFFAGYLRANTPEEVAVVERWSRHAKRASMSESIQCDKCGWSTKSIEAYQYHYQMHPH